MFMLLLVLEEEEEVLMNWIWDVRHPVAHDMTAGGTLSDDRSEVYVYDGGRIYIIFKNQRTLCQWGNVI